jgi:NADP-dependent 3-hydroxy acid dehydrogenase YdfG
MSEDARLDGKIAIVTGASSGIGHATALALAAESATVVVTARREERLTALAEEIAHSGRAALALRCDVTNPGQVQTVVDKTLDAFGRIDILVNNAGIMSLAPLREARVDEWTRMVDVNVKGVLHFLAAVLPGMVERETGHIVNVGSLAGRRPFPGGGVYSATKFAIRSLTWAMHLELGAAHGIRVTDVQPGFVSTELLDGDPTTHAAWQEAWAERRTLQPEDVARAIVFVTTAPDHVAVNELLLRPTDQPT